MISGLAGFLPIHPRSYLTAWRNRKLKAQEEDKEILVNSTGLTLKTLKRTNFAVTGKR